MLTKRRPAIRSPQFAKKRKKQIWIKTSLIVLVLVGICATPPLLSHVPWFTIRTITIEGNTIVSDEDIEQYIRNNISGSYLHMFSKANIFLYPKETIEQGLLDTFSRLQAAAISFDGLQAIKVTMREREPQGVWCTTDQTQCGFLDSEGILFAPALTFSGTLYVKYVQAVDVLPAFGERVIDPRLLERIQLFTERIGKIGFIVDAVHILDDGDIELHTVHGGTILVSQNDDLETVYTYIESLVTDTDTIKDFQTFVSSFTYVDLRYGKKIFIK